MRCLVFLVLLVLPLVASAKNCREAKICSGRDCVCLSNAQLQQLIGLAQVGAGLVAAQPPQQEPRIYRTPGVQTQKQQRTQPEFGALEDLDRAQRGLPRQEKRKPGSFGALNDLIRKNNEMRRNPPR